MNDMLFDHVDTFMCIEQSQTTKRRICKHCPSLFNVPVNVYRWR